MTTLETNTWNNLAEELESAVSAAFVWFKNLDEEILLIRPAPGEWSAKEVLGHLVDSASNNHQRFVRLQITDDLVFPNYGPFNVDWVRIQKYQEQPWQGLLTHWYYFNLHLANVIHFVDEKCINNRWIKDQVTSITLGEMMVDYVRHLKAHLDQIKRMAGNF